MSKFLGCLGRVLYFLVGYNDLPWLHLGRLACIGSTLIAAIAHQLLNGITKDSQ